MSRLTLLLVVLGLAASSVSAVRKGNHNLSDAERRGKVLSLFNVVTFENEACLSTATSSGGNNRNGTCYTASECKDKGGTHSGNCAAGFGVCCVFISDESGKSLSQNCSYIANPGYPSTYSGDDTTFSNTITKCSCDVCFIRLDFESFTLKGPADTEELGGGECVDSFSVTTSADQSVPVICGSNAGKHMYVEVSSGCTDSISTSISLSGTSSTRTWDIKFSQIECGNPMAPPASCLEYLTSPTGRITSFNWNAVGESHLASQTQKVCIRSTRSSCCVRYTKCDDDDAFSLLNEIADMSMVNTECVDDYIEAQSFSPDCRPNGPSAMPYRLCGDKFNTVTMLGVDLEAICDCSNDFALTIHTDGSSDNAAPATANAEISKGLCLDYSLIGC